MTRRPRKKNTVNENQVLILSRRRCCICFGLNQDSNVKNGQISHLDKDPSNDQLDNLTWLCLDHHDKYDSITSQSKGFTIGEVKKHRESLYRFLAEEKSLSPVDENLSVATKPPNSDKTITANRLITIITEEPHKCSFCGYSILISLSLEDGHAHWVHTVTCPNCGNIDKVDKYIEL